MATRRDVLVGVAFAPALPLLARRAFAGEESQPAADALASSQLVYLTPLKSDGEGEPLQGGDLVRLRCRQRLRGHAARCLGGRRRSAVG